MHHSVRTPRGSAIPPMDGDPGAAPFSAVRDFSGSDTDETPPRGRHVHHSRAWALSLPKSVRAKPPQGYHVLHHLRPWGASLLPFGELDFTHALQSWCRTGLRHLDRIPLSKMFSFVGSGGGGRLPGGRGPKGGDCLTVRNQNNMGRGWQPLFRDSDPGIFQLHQTGTSQFWLVWYGSSHKDGSRGQQV